MIRTTYSHPHTTPSHSFSIQHILLPMPMEAFSLSTTFPSSLSSTTENKPSASHLNLSHFTRYPCTSRAKNHRIRWTNAQASGSTKASTVTAEGSSEKTDSKDDNLVFVAGATGRVGSRTVRELIKLGFRVRAGVENAQRSGELVQSVEQLKLDGASGGGQAIEKLEIVECDLEKPDTIGSGLGNASTVICSIGASERGVLDITAPFKFPKDYQATINLIDAATVAKVKHFILVTSLGTNKIGFPVAILYLFWGFLIWKTKEEEALLASGLPYTIVRTGCMEQPTDAFKETHNIILSTENTLFKGQVSNLQIAELMAVMAKNRDLSYCKIVEVIAETTAPLTPTEELLAKIPSQRPYISSPKEPTTAAVSDPDPSANVVSEEPSIATQKETAQPKPVANQPLSPYTVYSDLKPPTSPSPSAPTISVSTSAVNGVPEIATVSSNGPAQLSIADEPKEGHLPEPKSRPLSPYIMYEDLKPPASPTPSFRKS